MMTESAHCITTYSALAVSPLPYFSPRREEEGAVERGYVQVGSETIYAEISGVGRQLHRHLPRAAFLVLPGAGHFPMWDRPTVFNEAVMQFLGRGNTPTPL